MTVKQKKLPSEIQLQEIAKMFSILADYSRLKILKCLMQKPLTVGELVAETALQQGNVSKHLSLMLQVNFVRKEKEGNFARYYLANPKLQKICEIMCTSLEDDLKTRYQQLSRSK